MSELVAVAAIAAIALLAAIPATLAALFAYRAASEAKDTSAKVDGRLDEMLRLTRAEGVSEGIALERADPQSPAT
jgi:FlaG/FlaF family flagellin (archaellin)